MIRSEPVLSVFKVGLNLFLSLRPRQWVKNLVIFAPLLFWGQLFEVEKLRLALRAFFVFTLIGGGLYLLNDLKDLEADRLHPLKKERPLAAGRLAPPVALITALFLLAAGLIYALPLPSYFFLGVLLFILLNLSYTLYFRQVDLLDTLFIAGGFLLRVLSGSWATSTPISSFFMLALISVALLISFGRRRHEITLLGEKLARLHRPTLAAYPLSLLDSIITSCATLTIFAYTLFAFFQPNRPSSLAVLSLLPQTLTAPKWLMFTIPLVIYGVFRYLFVIYQKREGGSPEEILFADRPLLSVGLLWLLGIVLLIYFVPAA